MPLTVNENEIRTLGAARKEYERLGQMPHLLHPCAQRLVLRLPIGA